MINDMTPRALMEGNVEKPYHAIEPGAAAHNAIYRGKYLGASVTAAQNKAIGDRTYDDLFIGDYWTINGVNWRIAALEYYWNCGDTACVTPHVVIVPDQSLDSQPMNALATHGNAHTIKDTAGNPTGYLGCDMRAYLKGNGAARQKITGAFSAARILTHRILLDNSYTITGEMALNKGTAWYDSDIDLMNENMVYGGMVFNPMGNTQFVGKWRVAKTIFPLFLFNPMMINPLRYWYWLRDVATAAGFCDVSSDGLAYYSDAGYSFGVRPAFSIKAI